MNFETEVSTIFDKHIPVKTMYKRPNQVPYMNRELRKAIYEKKMYYNRFLKNRSSKTWEQYRMRRNHVNKLKRKSENMYFQERCTGGCKQTDFWQTIKPYFSKKNINSQNKIILQEANKTISKNEEVAEIFNSFFL